MTTLFISDLHLSENAPETTKKLQYLLKNLPEDIKGIYILGDLFEVWIGDDEASSFQLEMAELFKKTTQQCPIYFMPGNRDFLLGKHYCARSNLIYLNDPTVIELNGIRTLLLHGDSLCKQDKQYQFYRAIVRSKLFNYLFQKLPLSYRKSLAKKVRQRSSNRNQQISKELMDVQIDTLKNTIKKYQCKQAIYGHTHRPSIYIYDINKEMKKVFVLSDWHKQGNTLTFDGISLNKLSYF